MALNFPTSAQEIKQQAQTDVQNTLPASNPFLPNSYLDAIITAFSGRIFDFYSQLDAVLQEMFVDTADGTFLERWGSYVGILREPATQATGGITATGTTGSVIPIGTQVTTLDSKLYQTIASSTITTQTITLSELTRSGSTATATTPSPHLFVNGQVVTISNADQPAYNGTFNVTIISATEFTYTVSGTPTTPATGTISASSVFAPLTIKSIDYGVATNLTANTVVTFLTPIAGVNNVALVQYDGITGGTDQETDTALRDRILFRYQNPVALFNVNAIIIKARTVPGVTRVFVESPGTLVNTLDVSSITRNVEVATVVTSTDHKLEDGQIMEIFGADQTEYNIRKKVIVIDGTTFAYSLIGAPATPATGTITVQTGIPNGQVIIYFTRDNDSNIIPSAADVANVKNAIIDYNTGIKPANVADDDVIVKAPTPITVNFVFSLLSPNTPSMQTAVKNNIKAFFLENTTVGEDVLAVAYQAAIYNTIDPETGFSVNNFTLSSPTGDITIQNGQIAILGTVTFS